MPTIACDELIRAKLILVVPVLDYGGVESRVVIQSALMRESVREMRICCLSGDGAAAREVRRLGVPVDVLGLEPNLRDPRIAMKLWRYFKRQKPDIVHACTGLMTIHALGAAAIAGVSVRIAEEVGIPKRGRVGRSLFPVAYRMATDVIGVSDAVVRYLVEEDGVPSTKVTRIYNTVDNAYFNLVRPIARQGGPLRIVSVGRLVPEKSFDVLLCSLQKRIQDGSAVLSIVGDGPERFRLELLAKELEIEDRVSFVGHSINIASELIKADLFIMSSRSEGLPLALVEAMCARLPVIATAVGGVPEILSDEVLSNWLIPPLDAKSLERALDRMLELGEDARGELGERAHQIAVSRFGQQRYGSELVRLYLAAIGRESNPR